MLERLKEYNVQIGLLGSFIILAMGAIYILPFAYVVPLGWLVALVFGNVWLLAGLIWYYRDNVVFNPEGSIFKSGRKNGYPVLQLWALNGFFKFILGNKDKKGDIVFAYDKESREGIRIDPRIQSGSVPRCSTFGGLEVYQYAYKSPWSLSPKNALAMDTIIEHVRKKHPIMNTLKDSDIIEYVSRNRSELAHDCANLASEVDLNIHISPEMEVEYKKELKQNVLDELSEQGQPLPTDDKELAKLINTRISEKWDEVKDRYVIRYRTEILVKEIMAIQDEITTLPIKTDTFFSFAEAFQNISSALSGTDLQTIMQLFESAAEKKHNDDMKWWATVGLAGMMILVGAGLAVKFASIG